MNEQNKITKEQYLSLLDGDIKKSEYDSIINKINNRFHDILKRTCTKFGWFDYNNGSEDGDEYFKPNKYSVDDLICFDGDYTLHMPYGDGDHLERYAKLTKA